MALSEIQVRNAKPATKARKLFDTGGLYLHITLSGGRWWRFKYRFDGKEKLLSLGVYPDVGLKDAREKRDDLRKQIAAGIDPGTHRKAIKTSRVEAQANSFEVIAREWHAKRSPQWVPITAAKKLTRLEQDVFPWIGQRPIHELKAPELLSVLRRIEARAAHELARRVRQIMGQIFRYAIATGRADRDPAADLRDALPPAREKHHAAITDPKAVGALIRAIDGFAGEAVTRAALRLAPRLFVRPGELRAAEWSEIDLDAALWRIPAARMKMRDAHLVPLSRQAIEVLGDYINSLATDAMYSLVHAQKLAI